MDPFARIRYGTCRPDAVSLAFHPLPSGAYCISRTAIAARKPRGRRAIRACTQCLVVPPKTLARFANNPFALLHAVQAAGALRVAGQIPDQLESVRLSGGTAAVDTGLLVKLCENPGPQWMSVLVQAALDSVTLALVAGPSAEQVVAGLLNCLPPECRTEFSFSTAREFSPRRPFRIVALSAEREGSSRPESVYNVATLRLSGDPPDEFAPVESWPRFVHRALKSGQLSFWRRKYPSGRFPLRRRTFRPSDFGRWRPLGAASFETTGPGEVAGEYPSGMSSGQSPASDRSGTPPSQPPKRNPSRRSQTMTTHAAHPQFSVAADGVQPPARISIAPSRELKPAESGMLAKLEELDVLVFDAISGKPEALTRLRAAAGRKSAVRWIAACFPNRSNSMFATPWSCGCELLKRKAMSIHPGRFNPWTCWPCSSSEWLSGNGDWLPDVVVHASSWYKI